MDIKMKNNQEEGKEDGYWEPCPSSFTFVEFKDVVDQFRKREDLEDFRKRLPEEFEQSWRSRKHGKSVVTKAGCEIRRIRIGKENRGKSKGYRVTVFEEFTKGEISWMIILLVDDKLKNLDKWPDKEEMIEKAESLRMSSEKRIELIGAILS